MRSKCNVVLVISYICYASNELMHKFIHVYPRRNNFTFCRHVPRDSRERSPSAHSHHRSRKRKERDRESEPPSADEEGENEESGKERVRHSVITLALGEECEGNAFRYVSLSVRMSVRTSNSKTIAPIDLICLHKKAYTRGSGLLYDDPDWDLDSIIYLRILHHWEIG